MPASPARTVAFKILLRVQKEASYASELLHSDLLRDLSAADRGLCTEIVYGVLRWQSALDHAIAAVSDKQPRSMDAEVLIALRIAAYQIRFLDRIPARAAINESVELVKAARKRSAAGFANAVLRKLASAAPPLAAHGPIEDLAQRLAHPQWLISRWMEKFGAAATQNICEYDQRVPETVLRVEGESSTNARKSGEHMWATENAEPTSAHNGQRWGTHGVTDIPNVVGELRREGVETAPGAIVSGALRVVSGDVVNTNTYRERRVFIQDEASQLVALLVGRGSRILDCCAAPGSKTAVLAFRNPETHIVAAELHPHRARLLEERVSAKNVEVLTADVTALQLGPRFDRVLADVPCSGTGTLARNPEIKWKLRKSDLEDLHKRRVAILEAALRHVAPGGRAVYSTCSLETEENSAVVERVLGSHPDFRLVPCRDELVRLRESGELVREDLDSMVRGAFLRTLPGVHPCDGFFAAILEKD
ncbi:MAG: 16S rRNA (cytosine(967)-C(5))-methyltransferase RsmB [Acidobacteriaceae bacterium]